MTVDNICIDGSSISDNLSTALDNAIANYNAEGLTIEFSRVSGSSAGCDAVIDVYTWDGTSAK